MKKILLSILLIVLTTSTAPSSTFTLTFEYAARSGVAFQSCLANVIWNNDIILSIVPTDYDLHTATVDVTVIVGANILQFEGAGASDGLGFDFTNVALVRQGDSTNTNILVNGDFSSPNVGNSWEIFFNTIPGWTGQQMELGNVHVYRGPWSTKTDTTQIIQLDAFGNFQITQILTFDSNFQVISTPPTPSCDGFIFQQFNLVIQFDWAPTTVGTKNLLTSQANVLWNNYVLDSLIPTNSTSGVNHASYTVLASLCGQNYLQFDGTEESDGFGMSISNVQLTLAGSSSTNIPIGAWTAANPEFADCSTFNTAWSAGQCFSLDSGTNQRYTHTITIAPRKVFDIVGPLTKTAFACLAQQGYNYVNVRASSNTLGVIDPNAIQTLQNAQAAGLQTAIYIVICPTQSFVGLIQGLLYSIPSNLYSMIWLKVISDSPDCSWQSSTNTSINCQIFAVAFLQAQVKGVPVGAFSTKAIWNSVFGTVCPLRSYWPNIHLWYADYQRNGIVDPTESFSDFTASGGFAGWTQPDLKNTVGTTHIILCNNPAWHALINIDWHL